MVAAVHIPNIRVRRGVPVPEKQKQDTRKVSEIIASLKKGESFIVAPEHRSRVLIAANYLRKTGAISFRLTSASIVEGGVPAIGIWRVEE